MLLFWVLPQIVKFQRLVWLDGNSFPVTVAGSTLLAWELPIKNSVVCINLLTIEQWQNIHAVDVLRQILGSSRKSCQSRHYIREIDDVVQRLHRHLSWLVHDERYSDSSFVELCLTTAESGVAVEEFQWSLNGCTVI